MVTLFFSHFRDVDKVHDLMDDVAEQQEIANEISDAISNPVGFGQDMDEVNRENYIQPLACWVKISAEDILKDSYYFSWKIGFYIPCKLSLERQFAWNVKACFVGKLEQIHVSLICCLLNFVQRVVKVNPLKIE